MDSADAKKEGLRERKRRQTRQRIAETGLRLFVANGYEATTLDAIAAAADISRRTFFYYFKSKEDILLAWQDGAGDALRAAVVEEARGRAPLDAVHKAIAGLIAQYETDEFIVIDGLMRSTETLRARKQGSYERLERCIFSGLCEAWPQPERHRGLRLVAMVSIGAMRLTLETWLEEGRARPIIEYLDEAFAKLTVAI